MLLSSAICLALPWALPQERVAQPPLPQVWMKDHEVPDTTSHELPTADGGVGALGLILPGTQDTEFGPIAFGPAYTARFDEDGLTFLPALGRSAPETRRLTYRFEQARVGGVAIQSQATDVAPQIVDGRVEYDRGGLVEIYEPLEAGLEQSFLLEALPTRSGDLVVEGYLDSDLVAAPERSDAAALRFVEPGLGTLTIDKVLGIDAAGREVPGTLRLVGDRLELVLPAEFVREAALPLLLDPLISLETDPGVSIADCDQVDVASIGKHDTEDHGFAVAFCRYYSATDPDIFVTRGTQSTSSTVELAPQYAETLVAEAVIGTFDQNPTIVYRELEATPRQDLDWALMVAWQRSDTPDLIDPKILYRVFGSNGGMFLPGEIGNGTHPDAGTVDEYALVAYDAGFNVRTRSLTYFASGNSNLGLDSLTFGYQSNALNRPAVSSHATTTDPPVFLVAAEQDFVTDSDLLVLAMDRFAVSLSPQQSVLTIGPDEEYPDVAVSGKKGLLVFQRETFKGSGDNDVVARSYSIDPGPFGFLLTADPEEIVVEGQVGDDERYPAVAAGDMEWIVGWMDEAFSGLYTATLRTLDLFSCVECEPRESVHLSLHFQGEIELAAANFTPTNVTASQADRCHILFDRFGTPDSVVHATWVSHDSEPALELEYLSCEGQALFGLGSGTLGSDYFRISKSVSPGETFGLYNLNADLPLVPCGKCAILPLGSLSPVVATENGWMRWVAKIPCDAQLVDQKIFIQGISGFFPFTPLCDLFGPLSFSSIYSLTFSF
jgi:hypothetical protein